MRYLLVSLLPCLLLPSLAAAQGSIRQSTPTTFATPSSISDWDPKSLHIEPGASAAIVVELVARNRPDVVLRFEYPRDCGSFGADGNGQPNPPVCPNRDTSAEIDALITTLNTINLSTRSLWRRIFDNLCADFPSKFPGGCTVQ